MSDPWAAAQQQTAAPAAQQSGSDSGESSQLADNYAGQPSQLFSGNQGAGPSIINSTHKVGTKRTGIVAKPPYDRHSTNQAGKLRYWQDGQNSPVLDAINPATGQRNRPVKDTVVVLDTDYTMDAVEAQAIGRDVPFEGGRRSLILAGRDLKAFLKELEAKAQQLGITCDADLVGKRVTVHRVAEKPNPNGGHTIKIHEYEISNA